MNSLTYDNYDGNFSVNNFKSIASNSSDFTSFPTVTITDKNGTRTFKFDTEEEYKQYMKERDENHSKTGAAFAIYACLYYGTLFFIPYNIYCWLKK